MQQQSPTPLQQDDFAHVREAKRALDASFATGRTIDRKWREEQLGALSRMLRAREEEFLHTLKSDLSKPAFEAWTAELGSSAGDADYARKHLRRWMRSRLVSTPAFGLPAKSWVQPEPLGTVLIIGAWNYPLQLILTPLAAALAAGNCAIVKPSELAPATSSALARWVPEYLDGDCVRVIEGAVPETTALLAERFDHILYTGGGQVGRIVMSAAAKHLTPVTLELGGKSPCVVLPDARLETTARRIVWGKFMNAGQTCIAPDYILTDAETESRLIPLLRRNIEGMFGADPRESKAYARIVNRRHAERLAALLDSGTKAIGGECDPESRYFAPTVLTDVAADSQVMREEIFGPILPIVRTENLDTAISFIRAGDKPLSAYLFTTDKRAQSQFLQSVSAGSACINDVMMFYMVPELPFGGVGASGMGCYSGEHGFRTFSHFKAVMRRGWWPDVKLRYAPYTEAALRLIKRLK